MTTQHTFSAGLLLGLALAIGFGLALEAKRKKPEPPPPLPPDIVYALDSAALRTYGEQVRKATGDSLRALLASQAAKARKRLPGLPSLPPKSDTVRDTVSETCVPTVDLQTVMLSDTTCQVSKDSLARRDTVNRYHIRLQREALVKERRKSRLLAIALGVLLTVGTVLNFAD
jgi:hypothetical protein